MLLTVLGLVQLFTMSVTSGPTTADNEKGSEAGHQSTSRDEEEDNMEDNMEDIAADIYDLIKDIQDPEKPNTLEELDVVFESGVKVYPAKDGSDGYIIRVEFTPTVPHCSLATLIGLCIRVKLDKSLPKKHKLDIFITKGTHSTEEEINKQINDKERIAAAMENPNLKELVEKCVADTDT